VETSKVGMNEEQTTRKAGDASDAARPGK
jgi:hypothetical protein